MWPFKKKEDTSAAHAEPAQPAPTPSGARAMRVGKWDVEEKVLGEGGYGKVTRATDRTASPPVPAACKWIDTRRMKKAAIEREVRVNQKLKHPNIAQCLDYIFIDPTAFVIFELCAGGELFERVISSGKMAEDVARKIFVELCAGVSHCHEKGIVHRDLKLENVMLGGDGTIKIIDFGLAAEYEPNGHGGFNMSTLYETCGSKSYAAPEVLSGKGYSGFGADVWSCGICLFAMLAGFFPLDEATSRDWRFQRGVKAVAQGASLVHTIYGFYQRQCPLSAEAVALLDGMLAIDPTRRLTLATVLHSPWVTGRKLPPGAARGGGGAGAATAPLASYVAEYDPIIDGGGPTYRSVMHSTSASTRLSLDGGADAEGDAGWRAEGCCETGGGGGGASEGELRGGGSHGGGGAGGTGLALGAQPSADMPGGGWVAAPMSFSGPAAEIAAAAAAEERIVDNGCGGCGGYGGYGAAGAGARAVSAAGADWGGGVGGSPGDGYGDGGGYAGGYAGDGYSSDSLQMVVDDTDAPVYRAFGSALAAALPPVGGGAAPAPASGSAAAAAAPPSLARQRAFDTWPELDEEGY